MKLKALIPIKLESQKLLNELLNSRNESKLENNKEEEKYESLSDMEMLKNFMEKIDRIESGEPIYEGKIRRYSNILNLLSSKWNITLDIKSKKEFPSDDSPYWEIEDIYSAEELITAFNNKKFENYPDLLCRQEGRKRVWYEPTEYSIRWGTEFEQEDKNKSNILEKTWNDEVSKFLKNLKITPLLWW